MNITRVFKDNIDAFEPFLTEEIKTAVISEEAVCLGAYDDEAENDAVGVVAGQMQEDVFRIRYLFVASDRRREGIASYMLDYLSQICLQNEITGFLAEYPDDGRFPDVEAFFDDGGFSSEESKAAEYTLILGDVKKLPVFRNIETFKTGPELQSFNETKRALLTAFSIEQSQNGDGCLYRLLADRVLDEDLSLVYVKDNKIVAVFAVSCEEEGITVEWAYSDPKEYTHLLTVIKGFASRAARRFPDDTRMTIIGMTEPARELLEGLFKESIKKRTGWTVRTLGF